MSVVITIRAFSTFVYFFFVNAFSFAYSIIFSKHKSKIIFLLIIKIEKMRDQVKCIGEYDFFFTLPAVSTDVNFALGRVDLVTGERANLEPA